MQETSIDTEVLIVGAGPSGATASLALSTYGIRNICLSKYSSTAQSPRAHITNQVGGGAECRARIWRTA